MLMSGAAALDNTYDHLLQKLSDSDKQKVATEVAGCWAFVSAFLPPQAFSLLVEPTLWPSYNPR